MSDNRGQILVVDDEPFARTVVRRMLELDGWSVAEARTTKEAGALLAQGPEPVALLLDVLLEGESGLEFLERSREDGLLVPIIVMTSMEDVETAVRAMKGGAYDFLVKPVTPERLRTAIHHAEERRALLTENRDLRKRVRLDAFGKSLVGESPAMKALFAEMERVVETDIAICLLGETGTGKELVARWLHENGPRAKGPFVDINCAAIPETLIESELFGHEKGAFTGAAGRHRGKLEQADGGTLFLDELGEMAHPTQARLLRVLQEKTLVRVGGSETVPYNARLVSATQRDLKVAVQEGRFREDLYFRVVVYPLRLPPLRERTDDIPLLVHHFIRVFRSSTGRPVEGITPEALVALEAYAWPGNVRELQNAVFRAVVSARGSFLTTADFPTSPRPDPAVSAAPLPAPPGRPRTRICPRARPGPWPSGRGAARHDGRPRAGRHPAGARRLQRERARRRRPAPGRPIDTLPANPGARPFGRLLTAKGSGGEVRAALLLSRSARGSRPTHSPTRGCRWRPKSRPRPRRRFTAFRRTISSARIGSRSPPAGSTTGRSSSRGRTGSSSRSAGRVTRRFRSPRPF
ncbi:MAG: sigma-54-dependent Fis family transcriptional regulator [Holophagales bacterium]|nr:sigma-54-dependent Fis family transcriptional regulator [Holophagales bacterium]